MVEIAVGADRLAGFDHGHGGLAPGMAGFLEQDLVARQAEDIVHGVALAPAHQVLAREAAVAAQHDGDIGQRSRIIATMRRIWLRAPLAPSMLAGRSWASRRWRPQKT